MLVFKTSGSIHSRFLLTTKGSESIGRQGSGVEVGGTGLPREDWNSKLELSQVSV